MYHSKGYITNKIVENFKYHNIAIPISLIIDIVDGYKNIPFHNIVHAFEVFLMTNELIKIVQSHKKYFTKYDITIILICALCHDILHEGKTNNMLKLELWDSNICKIYEEEILDVENIMTYSNLSNRSYDNLNDIEAHDAFNERIHIDSTIQLVQKYKKQLFGINADFYRVKDHITSLILCTDLTLHDYYLEKFNIRDKHSIANMIIKIADLSHPLQHFSFHSYWVLKIKEETNHFNTFSDLKGIADDTIFFIKTFLYPLLNKFNEHFKLKKYMKILDTNLQIWYEYSSN